MFRLSVTFIVLLLASSKAWDFDLLLEKIYDHFESSEEEGSSESSENSTKPATSSPASAASPATTASSSPPIASSTATTPRSSSAAPVSATPLSAPSARTKRDLANFQREPKELYENVPYPSNYAPNYKESFKRDTGNGRESRHRRYHPVKSEKWPEHQATKDDLIKVLLKLLEHSEKEVPKVRHPNISQRIRITVPQEKVQRVVVDESSPNDKQKCKSDDKNHITCVTERKIYETIKIDPKDHSEVHKIEENIRVSIVKDDKPPKDEAVDKVFKHKRPYMHTASYEEDDDYPHPYHHRHDKNRGHHHHEYITSSRFNAEDDVKESEKKQSPTIDATKTAS